MRKFLLGILLVVVLVVPSLAGAVETLQVSTITSFVTGSAFANRTNAANNIAAGRYVVVGNFNAAKLYVSLDANVPVTGAGFTVQAAGSNGILVLNVSQQNNTVSLYSVYSALQNISAGSSPFTYYANSALGFLGSCTLGGSLSDFFPIPPPPPTPTQLLHQTTQTGLAGFQENFGVNSMTLLRVGVAILAALLVLYLIPRWARSLLH